jgi:hypothetical protein
MHALAELPDHARQQRLECREYRAGTRDDLVVRHRIQLFSA